MKVLQINSFFSVGGPPRIMNGIYDTLKENGHECRIAAAREKMIYPQDSIQIGSGRSVYVNALKARLLDDDGFSAKKATRILIGEIERYDPDVIQLHNLHGYYINVEILFDYLKQRGKPVVWTLHDCWPVTGHCPHFTMVKCDRYKDGCFCCPQKKEYPASYVLDRSKQNWERKKAAFTGVSNLTIVCVSQWLESVVNNSYLKEYKTQVIYNGIDLNHFKKTNGDFRKQYHLEGKRVLLGVAQHWVARKGLYDYIKLAQSLDDRYRIVLVGLTAGEVKNLPENIIPIPPLSNDDKLAEIYSACDLCLNLSYEETFGLTSVEALACGTPIIAYDLTAVPEVAKLFNAPVIHTGDIETLKGVIEERFARHISSESYDVSQFEEITQYQNYRNLYKELIELK